MLKKIGFSTGLALLGLALVQAPSAMAADRDDFNHGRNYDYGAQHNSRDFQPSRDSRDFQSSRDFRGYQGRAERGRRDRRREEWREHHWRGDWDDR